MKLKRRIGIGLVVAATTYCVLAYIFMWPPVVTEYGFWGRLWDRICMREIPTSDADSCINNMRQLDAAINQWALDKGKHPGDSVTLEQLKPYLLHGQIPTCPQGGTYNVTVVGANPTCSFGFNNPIWKEKHNGEYLVRIRRGYFYYEDIIPHELP
jgi:hypothetical protein